MRRKMNSLRPSWDARFRGIDNVLSRLRIALVAGSLMLVVWGALAPPAVLGAEPAPASAYTCTGDGPSIEVWYGARQSFGNPGIAQKWVNILGTVHEPPQLAELSFSLNGGRPQSLRMGPDGRRLLAAGDFNAEIAVTDLRPGENHVVIDSIDQDGRRSRCPVTVEYHEQAWPLPYSINWSEVADLQAAVQVVDGRWLLTEAGIRTGPHGAGYDRLLAIGDRQWRNYEVIVPITVHAVDEKAYNSPESVAPGVGVNLRWQGHSHAPVRCEQPHCGWYPMGGSNWYDFGSGTFQIRARPPKGLTAGTQPPMDVGGTYWFKARVESRYTGNVYRLKVWQDGEPEPAQWSAQRLTRRENAARGSLLLVAHHVEATFGNVSVSPLVQPPWWEIFTGGLALLALSPKWLALLAGLLLAIHFRNRKPRSARIVSIAALMLILEALIGLAADRYLALVLHAWGWSTRSSTLALLLVEYARSFLVAAAWIALLVAIFDINPRRRTANGTGQTE